MTDATNSSENQLADPGVEHESRTVPEDTIGLPSNEAEASESVLAPRDPADIAAQDDLSLNEMAEAPSHVIEGRLVEALNADP